jgi:hypothetical protein
MGGHVGCRFRHLLILIGVLATASGTIGGGAIAGVGIALVGLWWWGRRAAARGPKA